jgi:DNA phosphorothioation-associated putative methyltransferase
VDAAWYQSRVRALGIGKRVAGHVYLHADALAVVDPELHREMARAVAGAVPGHRWNVAKLSLRQPVVSALWYPTFRDEAHPALSSSVRLDLATGRARAQDSSDSADPPILHRKETFVAASDPEAEAYAELTRAEEAAGLYEHPQQIGHLRAWTALLEEKGLRIEGHGLTDDRTTLIPEAVEVLRHRTAIARRDLSRPVQLLISSGLLQPGVDFFDYGCGHGDDVRSLQAIGYVADGWDPVFRPDAERRPADIVNLGYVLNVIEDAEERRATLRRAFELCRRCLCVSVLVGTSTHSGEVRPYGDGLLTSRGTFQKYFRQEEAAVLVGTTTEMDAVPLEPGIFVVFRSAEEQNAFLLSRVRRTPSALALMGGAPRRPEIRSALVRAFRERHGEEWAEVLSFVEDAGRMPATAEWSGYGKAAAFGVRHTDLRAALVAEVTEERLRAVERERRDSLLVFLAICRFRRVPRLNDLPIRARNDIRHHFGSYREALAEAETQLFSIGNGARVAVLCADAPVGLNSPSGFFFQQKDLAKLDPVLQIYARVGELLGGDLESAQVVKIHKKSPKLTLFQFRDYEADEYPLLVGRTKIDLQSQQVRFFNHERGEDPEVLIGKRLLEDCSGTVRGPMESLVLEMLSLDRPLGAVVKRSRLAEVASGSSGV